MKQYFLKQNNTQSINLIFLGYGQDELPFGYLKEFSKEDLMLIYDYTDSSFNKELLKSYSSINLIAWSMGVMIAPLVLKEHNLLTKVKSSYAINGSPEGIDDELGISKSIWMATIESLSQSSVQKFYRRMCLDASVYEEYIRTKPNRDLQSLRAELLSIISLAKETPVSGFNYTLAYIGLKDKIINPKCMQKSFELKGTSVKLTDTPHYSKEVFIEVLKHNDTQ